MPYNNPLTLQEVQNLSLNNPLHPRDGSPAEIYMPEGYLLIAPPSQNGPIRYRLLDAAHVKTGIMDPNRLGTGAVGDGNLYLADDGTWKPVSSGGGSQNLQQVTDLGNVTTNTIDTAGTKSDYFLLDTTATPTLQQGMLFWDEDRSTVGLQMNGVEARLGQDNFWYVKNQTGSPIPKGTAVMAVGALGASSRILVAPMIADGSVDEQYFLGITAEEILNGEDGFVTNIGKIRGIDTSVYGAQAGQILYCDPANPGGFTITQPQAPNLNIPAAFTVDYKSNGTIAVRALPGYHLSELHDVYINTPSDQDILLYNGTNNRWENTPLASAVPTPTLQSVTDAGSATSNKLTIGNSVSQISGVEFLHLYRFSNSRIKFALGNPSISQTNQIIFNNTVGAELVNENRILFTTNSAERMRVESTGNVLIGTTTDAGYKLDVNGSTRSSNFTVPNLGYIRGSGYGDTQIQYYYGTWTVRGNFSVDGLFYKVGDPGFVLYQSNQNYNGSSIYLTGQENGYFSQTNGTIWFKRSRYATEQAGYIKSATVGTPSSSDYESYMAFGTTPSGSIVSSERMRIASTGNVLIGTTTESGHKLRVEGTVSALLTNATQTNQVYYDSVTGELTYGALPVVTTPTLDAVTTAGNTTTNAITVGGLTVDTDLIYTDTVNNRVGIGTTGLIPGTLLTINGSVSIAAGQSLKLDPSANIYMVAASTQFRLYTGSIAALSIPNTGNVLINTTTDSGYKLDINGSTRVQGSLTVDTNTLFVDSVNNRVGIGTTTPTASLHVAGPVRVEGSLQIVNLGDLNVEGKLFAGLSQGTGNKQVFYNSVSQQITFDDYLPSVYITSTQISNWDTAYGWGDHATAGYLTSYTETDTLDSVTTRGNTTTNSITVGGLIVDTNTLVVDSVNDRVGIGTSTPAYKLDVVGTTNVSGKLTVGGGMDAVGQSTVKGYGGVAFIVQETQNNNAVWIRPQWYSADTSMYFSSDWFSFKYNATPGSFGYGNIITMRSNGNVMIGSAQDNGWKLEVAGTFRATGAAQVATSTGGLGVGTTSPGYKLDVNGNGRFVTDLFVQGNLGVGTTSPIAKLDVLGQGVFQGNYLTSYRGVNVGALNINNNRDDNVVDFTQGIVFTANAGNQGAWTHAGIVSVGSGGWRGNLVFGTDDDGTKNTTGIVERMRITSSGNVGIGTTSPAAKLHVSGKVQIGSELSANAYGALQLNQASNIDEEGITVVAASQGRSIRIWVDEVRSYVGSGNGGNGPLVLNEGSGNVLLGTTIDSGYKLEVNGNVKVSGTIQAVGGTSADWNTAYSWGDHSTQGYITGTTGFTGTFTVPTNPPGQQNLDIQNGVIVNVF